MKHLDEAEILAVRDGEPVSAATREHLEQCVTCIATLREAEDRAEALARTLSALDGPVEATAAKAGVRGRLGAGERAHRRWGGRHLGRAAALLLVTAGAAAALPWSPVRSLLRPAATPDVTASPSESPSAPATGPTRAPAESGIAVAVPDGFVQVVVRGADPGTELAVTWSEQAVARLSAPPGSRFTYAAGRIEVDASRGAIQVELPRGARRVSLEVDGRLYLSGSSSGLDVLGPAVDRSADSIRFRVEAP
jgi:hypothetical protein